MTGVADVRRRLPAVQVVVAPCVGFGVVVGLWWLTVRVLSIDEYLLPAPADVVTAGLRVPGPLLRHGWVTLTETVAGFGIATAAGVSAGTALVSSRLVERTLYPLLLVLHAVPKVAVAPLLLVWLGFGQAPKIVMAAVLCFFPIAINTASGLMATAAELDELARALTVTRWRTFTKIRFPGALPQIFAGLKVALPMASVGAVIGEAAGGASGLGFLIARSSGSGDVALAFSAITVLCAVSIALFYLLCGVERLLLPWTRATTLSH